MKRKIKHICLSSVLTISALSCMNMAVHAEETGFAVCDEGYLNVRSDASQESEVIGKLYHNGKVEILDTSPDGAWYHIHSGNVDGYVSSDYIATGTAAMEAPLPKSAPKYSMSVPQKTQVPRSSARSMKITNMKSLMIRATGSKS